MSFIPKARDMTCDILHVMLFQETFSYTLTPPLITSVSALEIVALPHNLC